MNERYEHFNEPPPKPDHDPELLMKIEYGAGGCALLPMLLLLIMGTIMVWVVVWTW